MSPTWDNLDALTPRVPRASGDEPGEAVMLSDDLVCSPRERG